MRLPALGLLALVACARAPAPIARDAAPAELAKAETAIAALRARLTARLTEAMGTAGPEGAIDVCGAEAPGLAAQVGREHGVELGRTSFKLRNPLNAPRPWAAAYVSAAAGSSAAAARPALFDLGDRVGALAPIPVAGICLGCHGPRASLPAGLAAALASSYPADQAVDFAEGDLRGFFWVEVPKVKPRSSW